MTQEHWNAVERYIGDLLVGPDPALDAVQRTCTTAGLPPIHVSAALGKLLYQLAQIRGARNILEVGTLGGYSTIWLARALPPGGRLVTLEVDPQHAEVAQVNIAMAGFGHIVELRVGNAIETLPLLASEGRGPFDLIFIDADKPNYPDYFQWALRLSGRGSVIVVDNVVRNGAVIDAASSDANVQGVRRFLERLAAEPRVSATAIQTVGSKGYDGFAIAIVAADSALPPNERNYEHKQFDT